MQCVNLDVFQGDDFNTAIDFFTDAGVDADLTGYTALAQIRSDVADAGTGVIAEIVITIVLPNTINLFIPHDVTEKFIEDYIWDLELTDSAGIRTTPMGGDIRVTLEVSRALAVAS